MALLVAALAVGAVPAPAVAKPGRATAVHTDHQHGTSHTVAFPAALRVLRRVVASGALVSPGRGYGSPGGSTLVRALQWSLARHGDEPGPIDGVDGPLTEQAVRRFQASHGLVPDGVAGPRTVSALLSPTPVLYPGAGYGLATGSQTVRVLQRRLAALGFAPGPADGRYGPQTMAAVKRFQRMHRLTVDGVLGPQTARTFWPTRGPIPAPRTIPARPTSRPAPSPRSVLRPVGARPAPTPPVTLVLIALAVLGLGTVTVSYRRTKEKVRRSGGLPGLSSEARR